MLQIEVFWVMAPCGVAVRCQRFGAPCCLHLQGETWTSETLLSCRSNAQHRDPEDLCPDPQRNVAILAQPSDSVRIIFTFFDV
jgi:hypothetical protein